MDVPGPIGHNGGMATVVDQKREQIIALAEKYGVQELYAFGSAIRDDFEAGRSDVDFLVRFKPTSPGTHADRYFDLLFSLEGLFETSIDLVEIGAITNPYFRQEAESSRELIYES
jgi:uncharacterized protein